MSQIIQVKRTDVAGRTPNTTNVANDQYIYEGELALNMADRRLFTSNGSVVIEVGANLTSLNVVGGTTVNGTLTINNTASIGNTTITGFANVLSNSSVGLRVSRSDSGSQYIDIKSYSTGHLLTFQTSSSNPKSVFFNIDVNGNTAVDTRYLLQIDSVEKFKVNSSIVAVNNDLTVTGFANVTSAIQVGSMFVANSTMVKITSDDKLTFNDGTTQNTAFRVYNESGTRIA